MRNRVKSEVLLRKQNLVITKKLNKETNNLAFNDSRFQLWDLKIYS